MKYLTLVLCFEEVEEDLGLKSVVIDSNDTGLPSDSKLIEKAAFVMLRSIYKNADDLVIQDLLNELNIKREGPS